MKPVPCLLAGALWATVSYAAAPLRADTPFIRGDVDQSGVLDLSDPIQTISYLFLSEAAPACLEAADADDTGVLDLTDPIFLLKHLFSGDSAPPAPFPDCARDPTPDALGCSSFSSPAPCPKEPPADCGNVVGRAAERGCGRVFVWGDEHINSRQYWPDVEAFWTNALDWLSERTCPTEERANVAFFPTDNFPELYAMIEARGMTVSRMNDPGQAGPGDILVASFDFFPQLDPAVLASWVEQGGALFGYVVGFGDRSQDYCEIVNATLALLGFQFDCFHRSPGGPVTEFGDHPLAAGLTPANAPFVNGTYVLDAPGFQSDVVARTGDCHPAEIPDCRKPIAFNGPEPGWEVAFDSDCGDRLNAGENLPVPGTELHVIGIYEATGGMATVEVQRTGPMVLVLSSYSKVHWSVDVGPGAEVERVILVGYEPQTADVPGGIELEVYDGGSQNGYGYGNDCGGGETRRLVAFVENLTGLPLRSFHGCYRAGAFSFPP